MTITVASLNLFTPTPLVTDEGIYGFFGEYRFLSNFYLAPVKIGDLTFPSSEAAYMAEKTFNQEEKLLLANLETPREAKKFGRKVTLREDWETYKNIAMVKVLLAKFTQNPDLQKLLLSTKDKYLEETNYWGDNYWGNDPTLPNGLNMLGKCLMVVRDSFK